MLGAGLMQGVLYLNGALKSQTNIIWHYWMTQKPVGYMNGFH